MSDADLKKWEGKYLVSEALMDVDPEPELRACIRLLPVGERALDLACGLGKNTLFLAQAGMDVTALDVSAAGLEKLLQAARALGVDEKIETLQADLDSYRLPAASYDLIVVVRYLDLELFDNIENALKPGGLLFYKTFNQNFLRQRPGFNPEYTIESEQLISAFPRLEPVLSQVQASEDIYAFMLARKKPGV